MASPKLRKVPFRDFVALVAKLPPAEQWGAWQRVWEVAPHLPCIDLAIDIRARLSELSANSSASPGQSTEPRTEAGGGVSSG